MQPSAQPAWPSVATLAAPCFFVQPASEMYPVTSVAMAVMARAVKTAKPNTSFFILLSLISMILPETTIPHRHSFRKIRLLRCLIDPAGRKSAGAIYGRQPGDHHTGQLPVLCALRTCGRRGCGGVRQYRRLPEGRKNGAADPALRRVQVEDPSHRHGRVEGVDGRHDLPGRYARTGENPGYLNLGKRVLAMAVRGSTVIRSDQDKSGIAGCEVVDHLDHLADISIGDLDGLVILGAVQPMRVSGVVDVIKMDEHERRAILLPVSNSRRCGSAGAGFMPHDVRSLVLQQIG